MNIENIRRIVEEIKYRRAKHSHLSGRIPRLIAIYSCQHSTSRELHGEVIRQVLVAVGRIEIPLALSLRGLAIIDILIRSKPMLLTSAQIERILRTDSFSARLAASFGKRAGLWITRKVIKVYIQRIRKQLETALRIARITYASEMVLVSESTELASVVAYRLAAPCEIVHRGSEGKGYGRT